MRLVARGTCGAFARNAPLGTKPGSFGVKMMSTIESPMPTIRAGTVGPPVIGACPKNALRSVAEISVTRWPTRRWKRAAAFRFTKISSARRGYGSRP